MTLILVAIGVGAFIFLVGWDIDRKEARAREERIRVLTGGRKARRRRRDR